MTTIFLSRSRCLGLSLSLSRSVSLGRTYVITEISARRLEYRKEKHKKEYTPSFDVCTTHNTPRSASFQTEKMRFSFLPFLSFNGWMTTGSTFIGRYRVVVTTTETKKEHAFRRTKTTDYDVRPSKKFVGGVDNHNYIADDRMIRPKRRREVDYYGAIIVETTGEIR